MEEKGRFRSARVVFAALVALLVGLFCAGVDDRGWMIEARIQKTERFARLLHL
jgi:hypothetical protein